jgi:hypothetical protein
MWEGGKRRMKFSNISKLTKINKQISEVLYFDL